MMHKIYYSQVAIPLLLFPLNNTLNVQTRGSAAKFVVPIPRTEAHRRTFMVAAPSMWNGLQASHTLVSDPEAFRSQLCNVQLSKVRLTV